MATVVTGNQEGVDRARELLTIAPGEVAGLVGPPGLGLTRVGLRMLADHAKVGMVACLDVRGWISPTAVWELGIDPGRFVIVRCGDPVQWGRVTATLLDGMAALYAEVPRGVKDARLRTLGALARSRRTPLLLRPVRRDLPSGVAQLRLDAHDVMWEGTDAGHGRLALRRLELLATGKAVKGMSTRIEVEDDGTHAVRLVSRLATTQTGIAVG